MGLLLLGAVAIALLLAATSSPAQPPAPGPAPPTPPPPKPGPPPSGMIHTGIVYNLAWLDSSNATDPLAEEAALIVSGWMPQAPLVGPVDVPVPIAGGVTKGWKVEGALRIGPSIPADPNDPSFNAGLASPLLLSEISGPDL